MSAGARCVCGSSNLVEDALYAQSQLVCADCGSVLSEGSLAPDTFSGSDVAYSYTTPQTKKPCPNLKKGLQRVQALCRVLRVNTEIEQSSQSFFTRAYGHESFLHVSLAKKEVLAGCCVLIGCRVSDWPITVGSVAYLVDAEAEAVFPVYREALKVLDVCVPPQNFSDFMEAHCLEYKLSLEQVPEELAADARALTRRGLELLELAAESWLVTGRKPRPLMMAAAYLSWQSLSPSRLRQKTSLDKFCRIAGVEPSPPAARRVLEIKRLLCKLGRELPWENREVTPGNVVPQVDDILSHRFALLRNALRSHEDALDLEESDTEKVKGQTEPNWAKRTLLAPPCVVKPKKRKMAERENVEVTGDEEISDGEISSYIRTPQEVRSIELAQEHLLQE